MLIFIFQDIFYENHQNKKLSIQIYTRVNINNCTVVTLCDMTFVNMFLKYCYAHLIVNFYYFHEAHSRPAILPCLSSGSRIFILLFQVLSFLMLVTRGIRGINQEDWKRHRKLSSASSSYVQKWLWLYVYNRL